MSDDGFDPCECMWSHELAMRRLLSLLRQSQAYCTDTECLEDVPGALGPQRDGGDNSLVMMMMCWVVLALVLYLLRPGSMRDRGDSKPNGPGQDSQDPPPNPPAVQ